MKTLTQTAKTNQIKAQIDRAQSQTGHRLDINRFTVPKTHVVSHSSLISELCLSSKEGAAKLLNKLFYFLQKNRQQGSNEIISRAQILAKELNRSANSILRYMKELASAGFIVYRAFRNKKRQVCYSFSFTDSFFEQMTLQDKKAKEEQEEKNRKKRERRFGKNKHNVEENLEQICEESPDPTHQNGEREKPVEPRPTATHRPTFSPLYLLTIFDSLNCARAKTLFAMRMILNTFQPEGGGVDSKISDEKPLSFSQIKTLTREILEFLNSHLEKPVKIHFTYAFERKIEKRLRSHFGKGKIGLERLWEYLEKCVQNDFLMGRKLMKSGQQFLAHPDYLFSEKMIESSWENKGMFEVYPPPKPKEKATQVDENGETILLEQGALPALSREEVVGDSASDTENRVKEKLYEALGAVTYRSWFHGADFKVLRGSDGEIDFSMATRFAREYVLTHYGKMMKSAFEAVFGVGALNKIIFDFEGAWNGNC